MRIAKPLRLPSLSRRRLVLGALSLLALMPGLGASAHAQEAAPEFRIVVHPSNAVPSVQRSFLADALLKKVTRWEHGEQIKPADLLPATAARRSFSERVLKRSVGAVRSYWQQKIFSGRDVPPPELASDDEVLVFVAKHPGAVGYVSGAAKLKGVKELSIK
jgi:hypothetical protein